MNVSDRAFFPRKIHYLESSKNLNSNFGKMSDLYDKNNSFSFEEQLIPGMGEVYNLKKIKDGYEINLNCAKGRGFVLNTFFNPYWKVEVNNREQEIINLSDVHIGVKVKKGKKKVRFLYSRELFKTKNF